jgi:hypothetical protein
MEFKFEPLVAFEWKKEDVLVGSYLPGGTYNCSRYPQHDSLRKICEEWEAEGKIRKIPLAPDEKFILNTFTLGV